MYVAPERAVSEADGTNSFDGGWLDGDALVGGILQTAREQHATYPSRAVLSKTVQVLLLMVGPAHPYTARS